LRSPFWTTLACRNQRKKKALADTKNQFVKVADENKTLVKQLEETQKDNYEVTEHLRTELLTKTQLIADLKTQAIKV
jgi:5'-deoxynucleotidase YfbR-like HD superfamily hydrolase